MAVAFDAVASASAAHTISSPVTVNIAVVSAVNGYVVVGVAIGVHSASVVTGCTIGGSAATELATVDSNNTTTGGFKLYGRVNAATGTVACVLTISDTSSDYEIGVMSFTGVHQTVSTGTPVTAFGSSGTASATLSGGVAGDLAVYGLCQGSGGATTPGTNETERWDIALNGSSGGGCGAGGHSTDVAGTISATFASDSWGMIAVNLLQSGGGGAFVAGRPVLPRQAVNRAGTY